MLKGIVIIIVLLSLEIMAVLVTSLFQGGKRRLVEWLIGLWFPKYHMVRIRKRTHGEDPAVAEAFIGERASQATQDR